MTGEVFALRMLSSTLPLAVDKLTDELVNGPAHGSGSTGGQVSGATDQRAGGWGELLGNRASWRAFNIGYHEHQFKRESVHS